MSSHSSEKHLPGLDTLRSVAILLVVGRHWWEITKWPSLKPFFGQHGWAGVDLFFVLSGFLIGSQLVKELVQTGDVDFKRFYIKRALRILPAYFTVLSIYFAWPMFREMPRLDPAWRYALFVMNFGHKTEAFSHAWSLCVEEHFYLVVPLLVALYGWRVKMPKPVFAFGFVIGGGMVLRYAIWASGAPFYPDLYRPTYVHLDGLAVGVGLALLRQFRQDLWARLMTHPWRVFAAGTSATVLGLWIFTLTGQTWMPAVLTYPLISFGFGGLVIAAMSPAFWLGRTRVPGAATVAALAFALYLTHKQMIHIVARVIVVDHDERVALTVVLALALMMLAAGATYYGVERPCLKLRDRWLSINRL